MVRMSVEGAKAATRQRDKANTNEICRSEILLKHLENNLVPISIPVKKEIKNLVKPSRTLISSRARASPRRCVVRFYTNKMGGGLYIISNKHIFIM